MKNTWKIFLELLRAYVFASQLFHPPKKIDRIRDYTKERYNFYMCRSLL